MGQSFVIPFVFALGTVVMWIAGGVLSLVLRNRSARGIRVVGEITEFGEFIDRGQRMYFAKYQATLPDGRVMAGHSPRAKNWQSPKIGTRVDLYFREENGEPFLSEAGPVRYLIPIILFAGSIPFIAMAVISYVSAKKNLASQHTSSSTRPAGEAAPTPTK